MTIAKNFDHCAPTYKLVRPSYPSALFEWMGSLTPCHDLALDCGTGNGQAALGLTPCFRNIIAVDNSSNQLLAAPEHPQITYHCSCVGKLSINLDSIDLIACASSVHWFDLDNFYDFCQRVLKPGGKIVCFTYTWPEAMDTKVQAILIKLDFG